jgi:hypothetical protein
VVWATRWQLVATRSKRNVFKKVTCPDLGNGWRYLVAQVFSEGDVLEVFISPVEKLEDNPSWCVALLFSFGAGPLTLE